MTTPDDLRVLPGQYACYRGKWGYVVSVDTEEVILSGWNELKTIAVPRVKITAVREQKEPR